MATEHTRILIDAGFSARRIKKMLEDTGESIDNIDAVFLMVWQLRKLRIHHWPHWVIRRFRLITR